jgi:hypothetical protein
MTIKNELKGYKISNNRMQTKIINLMGQIRSMRLRLVRIRASIDTLITNPYSTNTYTRRRKR